MFSEQIPQKKYFELVRPIGTSKAPCCCASARIVSMSSSIVLAAVWAPLLALMSLQDPLSALSTASKLQELTDCFNNPKTFESRLSSKPNAKAKCVGCQLGPAKADCCALPEICSGTGWDEDIYSDIRRCYNVAVSNSLMIIGSAEIIIFF